MPRMLVNWSELQALWEQVRDSGYFTEGAMTPALEEEVSRLYGMHAVAVSSAGAGLYAMCRVLDVRGHLVAVQNNTFYATGAMPMEAGAKVCLVDCRRDDFSMECASLGGTPLGIHAVILTHVGGGLARDYERIADWCTAHNAVLLEDAAHALGASRWRRVPSVTATQHEKLMAGHLSQGAVFSLYATKAVPVGEGGIIVTRDEGFARALREYRNYGKYVKDGVVGYRGRGFNLRMDEWSAAVALLQVRRIDELIERRQAAAEVLRGLIEPIIDYGPMPVSNWYKYPVAVHEAEELGITRYTGRVFASTDQLRSSVSLVPARALPNSEWVAQNHFCIPIEEGLYEGWSPDQVLSYLRGGNG